MQRPPKKTTGSCVPSVTVRAEKETEDLCAVISDGGPARKLSKDMAPFGDVLEEKDILDLIAYIRSFCKKP